MRSVDVAMRKWGAPGGASGHPRNRTLLALDVGPKNIISPPGCGAEYWEPDTAAIHRLVQSFRDVITVDFCLN